MPSSWTSVFLQVPFQPVFGIVYHAEQDKIFHHWQKVKKLIKKYTFLSLVFAFVIVLYAGLASARVAAPENCAVQPYDRGLLWQVQKTTGRISYIFGTMHSRDKRILQLPGAVMNSFVAARIAVFETTLDDASLSQSREIMMLPPDQSLQQIIGSERFMRLANLLAPQGITPQILNGMKIWAAASLLAQPAPATRKENKFKLLDKEMESAARQWKKQVYALETNIEQLSVFDRMPQSVQLEFLDQSFDEIATLEQDLEKITQYYLQGQTGWIWCDLQTSLVNSSIALRQILNDDLIHQRNVKMVDRLLEILPFGSVFVGIGALHLPGKKGVLNLLKSRGYRITKKY